MLNTIIIGASGYTGAELANLVYHHPKLNLSALYVSEQSEDLSKTFDQLYPKFNFIKLPLQPLVDLQALIKQADVILLATSHEVSHTLVAQLSKTAKILNKEVALFDLSGAYRVNNPAFYTEYYGFAHQYPQLLAQAVYGLAEWHINEIKQNKLIAVPGCYPTASQLALKPLINAKLIDTSYLPVINAVSGVSGSGRKGALSSHFCQVSLQAYGVFNHRHQPEIATHLGCELIFTPHLGNFKRGILATITAKLNDKVTLEEINQKMTDRYQSQPLIRLRYQSMPAIADVEYTPFCDIGWQIKGDYIILTSAIDNLLKGAASQAIQCVNIHFDLPIECGLL